jgi:hypothetical protein
VHPSHSDTLITAQRALPQRTSLALSRPWSKKQEEQGRIAMAMPAKNRICLWYDGDAEEAAQFYAETFPDSYVGAKLLAPGDYPSGKKGNVLTVDFTVLGIPCIGLNGGPEFKHDEAFSGA